MKLLPLLLPTLLLPCSALAKEAAVKGVLPELQLNKKTETDNLKTAAGAEALISKSEEMAIKQLEALVKKYKGTAQQPDLLFRLAELYARRAKTGRFVDLYRGDKKLADILSPKLTTVSAKTYLGKAIEQYQTIQTNYPKFAAMDEVLFNMGFAHDQRGESDQAIKTFLLIPERYTKSALLAETHMALGELYFLKQNYPESLLHFTKVQQWPKSPIAPIALYKSAWCSYNLKDTTEALKKIERLLALNKKQNVVAHVRSEARRDLALFYSEVGSVDLAIAYFKQHLLPKEVGPTVLDLSGIYERHGKLTEMDSVLSQFLKDNPADESAGTIILKRAQHHNEKHRSQRVVELLSEASKLCKNDKWKSSSKDTMSFCTETYPVELKDFAAEWWESWNKLNRNKDMVPSLAFIFSEYLNFEKPDQWHVAIHLAYAEFMFSQNDFKQAAIQYEGLAKMETLESSVLPTALYGAIVSLDRQLQSAPKDTVLREKLFAALNDYLNRVPGGEYTEEVRFKKAYLFYEAKDYIQSLTWVNKITPKTTPMKEKRDDLLLEIHRAKKDYPALVAASSAMLKQSTGERAKKMKLVYQSAQQAIIQQNIEKDKLEPAANLAKAFYLEHRPEEKALDALHLAIELWEKQKKYRPAAENSEILAKEMKLLQKLTEAEKLSLHANELFLKLGDLNRSRKSLQTALEYIQDSNKKKETLELLAEISAWYQDVDATEKAWQALEPQMSNDERKALLEKRLAFFEQNSPDRAKKLKDSLISKGTEPFFSNAQIAQADQLCQSKKWSQCYQMALKLNKESTPAPQRAQARYLQSKVLTNEYKQQSLKAQPERMGMVMAYKAEKFDKAVQVLTALSSKAEDLNLKKQALQDLIMIYNDYTQQLQSSLASMDTSNADLMALKKEVEQILPVLENRPKELELAMLELNKAAPAKQETAIALKGPFPELMGTEMRIYVPTWEEVISHRPLRELTFGNKSCVLTNIQKLNTLSALGREANACLSKGKNSELEAAALRMSDLFPDTPWGPFYLSVAASQQKSSERSLWYLKLAQKRAMEPLLTYEENRQSYFNRPDSALVTELKKIEGSWALLEEITFLTSLEQMKQNQCDEALATIKSLRHDFWKSTPLTQIASSRCPAPAARTVTSVDTPER